MTAEVFDWDQIGKHTLLCQGETAFAGDILESFAAKDVVIPLNGGDSHGATLRVRLLWQPQLLARKRTGTSLLSSTTRIFTSAPGAAFGMGLDVVGAGFDAGTKVLGTGGKVIGGGVSAIGRGIGLFGRREKSTSDASSDIVTSPVAPAAPTPTMSTSRQTDSSSVSDRRPSTDSTASRPLGREGTVNVTLVGARELAAMDKGGTSDPYVRVRLGSKVVHKTRTVKKTLQPEW